MFCTNCGKKVKEGALFCTECGAKLEGAETTPEPKKKNMLPIIIVAAVVVVALILGGIFLASGGLGSDKDRDDEDERTEQQVDDEESEEDEETESEEESETEEVLAKDYEDIVDDMLNGNYVVENSKYQQMAQTMGHILLRGASVQSDEIWYVEDFSATQKARLNYEIINSLAYSDEYKLETSEVEIEEEPYAVVYEYDRFIEYLGNFYEGVAFEDYYGLLVRYDDYVAYNGADGDSWIQFDTFTVYELDDYVMVEAPCYYMDNGGGFGYEYDARILFKITEADPFALQAVYVETWVNEISISSVTVSSYLESYGDKDYNADNLFDGDITTAWVEGVDGVGIGETIVIDLGEKQKVSGLAFVNGYLASCYSFNTNGKVTSVLIEFGDGSSVEQTFYPYNYSTDSKDAVSYWDTELVSLPRPIMTDKITITILGAEAGTSYEDTCISEIEIH